MSATGMFVIGGAAALAMLLVGTARRADGRWVARSHPWGPWRVLWWAVAALAGLAALGLYFPRPRVVRWLGLTRWPAGEVLALRVAVLVALALLLAAWALAGGLAWARALAARWRWDAARQAWGPLARPLAVMLAGLLALAAALGLSGWGLRTTALNWYETGVPVLPFQLGVGMALVAVLAVARRRKTWPTDGLVMLFLWAATTWWWVRTPAAPSFFGPAPLPPSGQPYPWSDALAWDLYGWQLLWGLRPNPLLDHLGYSGWLAWLHRWVGANYWAVEAWQSAALALLPALVYDLARRLGSRPAGVAAAFWVAAQGANGLRVGEMFNHVHPKMLMTEWPTALMLALATVGLVAFGQSRKGQYAWVTVSAAALALAVTFRFAALALLPAFAVGLAWLAGLQWRRGALALGLLALTALAVWAPWMLRSQARAGTPWFFAQKVQYAFQPWFRTPRPTPTPTPSGSTQPTKPPMAGASQRGPGAKVWFRPQTAPRLAAPPRLPTTTLAVIGQYWAHNLAAHFLTLPLAVRGYDLDGLWEVHPPLHNKWWYGLYRQPFTPGQWALLAGYLTLLAAGLAGAWARARWAGLVPLGVALAHHLAAAVARTGGGRYLVPVQWVLWLYLALGVGVVVQVLARGFGLGLREPAPRGQTRAASRALCALPGLLAALPLWMAWLDARPPAAVVGAQPPQAWAALRASPWWEALPVPPQALQDFLAQEGSVVWWGYVAYPRFFPAQAGIPEARGRAHAPQPYARLAGYLSIAPQGQALVREWHLPLDTPPPEPPWGEAFVIGCERPVRGAWWREVDVWLLAYATPQGPRWLMRAGPAPLCQR